MKMRIAFLVSVVLLVSSCASTPSSVAAGIQETDAKTVEKCQFVGSVFGNSMLGVVLAGTSASNAIIDAKEKASKLGATHIVVESMKAADLNGGSQATVRAYKCQ